MTVGRITVQRTTGTMCDVPNVAEQCALMANFDFCIQIQRFIVADGINEVLSMFTQALVAVDFFNFFVLGVQDAVTTGNAEDQSSLAAKEGDKVIFVTIATGTLPGDLLFIAEFVTDDMGVGGLLIIVVGIATTTGDDAG